MFSCLRRISCYLPGSVEEHFFGDGWEKYEVIVACAGSVLLEVVAYKLR